MIEGNILITGGTGTLGHAIMLYARKHNWNCQFTIYSRSELRLSRTKNRFPEIRTIIGDVRDYDRLASSVVGHDVVIHAAAMKRIPECELNPRECYLTNVIGSENVARACNCVVDKVIGISTDKACRAVTTYGASKLLLESIFMSYNKDMYTNYSAIRYGNVVASNGSVIPIWQQKYNDGESLPITDLNMTRFWMSPFDAVEAIVAGQNCRSIYVPSVSSYKMTELADHLFPGCKFDEFGLRSNEKLHEDLVSEDEMSIAVNSGIIVGQGSRGLSYNSRNVTKDFSDFSRMIDDAAEVEAEH